jgi:uncharacterized protein YndB with AHSA1/START domain
MNENDYGTLERLDNGDGQLTFSRHLAHEIDKVWAAITEPDQLKVWFPSTIDGDRAAGAALRFVFPHDGAPVMEGAMRVFDPPHVMELTWGEDVLRIELTPVTGGTLLTLTDTFSEYEKAARDAAGWHACLDRLRFDLDDEEWPYGDNGRWQELSAWYLEHFPADATTAPIPDFVN